MLQVLVLVCVSCCGAGGYDNRTTPFRLTVAHLNDTHSHLSGSAIELLCNDEPMTVVTGGFPKLAAALKKIRERNQHVLFLHAGDVFQGTAFFTAFRGEADAVLLNSMQLDAMCLGNHEFDKGIEVLADFARRVSFPLLAANLDASREPQLNGRICPSMVRDIGREKVGIIGLAHPDTPLLSNPGAMVSFTDPVVALRQEIKRLTSLGVNIIIVLSHCGFEQDRELAEQVEGIDIIVGGHSHTLLGDFAALGLDPVGPYPYVVHPRNGETVLIAHAWEWGRILGVLEAAFDHHGKIIQYTGTPLLLIAQKTKPLQSNNNPPRRKELPACIKQMSNSVAMIDDDPDIRRLLDQYETLVRRMYRHGIATVKERLNHRRCPDPATGRQSEIAPLVAEAMLWMTRRRGMNAQIALVNAGSLSGSMPAGLLSQGRVYDLLPYTNALVVLTVSGKDIRAAITKAVLTAYGKRSRGGMFPYGAGIRYNLLVRNGIVIGVTDITVHQVDGSWVPLQDNETYLVVVNEYMARGGDGYTVFAKAHRERRATGLLDVTAFAEYARSIRTLTRRPIGIGVVNIP
ncbi:MAG: 5'-nucleotidase/apyrase family protein [Desulfobacterota bacterium]|nr:5'-nucleotidase/apyrase family protein [Thermodesulfobacteriota bacterium]